MKIGIIGSGYVGSATGIGFYINKNEVTFHDTNIQVLKKLAKKGYNTEYDLRKLLVNNEIVFISVPTPSDEKGIIMIHINKVFSDLKRHFNNIVKKPIVVLKSTVLPGTCRRIKLETGIDLVYNPEFLQEATAIDDFLKPDRIIIAGGKRNCKILTELYKPFKSPKILRYSYETAELIKYASNNFFAVRISYFRQYGQLCKRYSIKMEDLRNGVMQGKFFGKHPWFVGGPYGGACLPKDLRAFINFMEQENLVCDMLKITEDINKK